MLTVCLICTIGYFIGWLRMIPAFAHRKLLRGLMLATGWLAVTWGGVQVAAVAEAAPHDGVKIIAGATAYMLFLAVVFYNITEWFKKRASDN